MQAPTLSAGQTLLFVGESNEGSTQLLFQEDGCVWGGGGYGKGMRCFSGTLGPLEKEIAGRGPCSCHALRNSLKSERTETGGGGWREEVHGQPQASEPEP